MGCAKRGRYLGGLIAALSARGSDLLAPRRRPPYSSRMAIPDYIHFFSWETRVSIELPVGFEEQFEDPGTHSAIYADDLDDDDESDDADDSPGARVMTKMTAVPETSPEAYRAIARASAEGPAQDANPRTVQHRREREIDGAPALRQVLTYNDEEAGIDVVRHETFAQLTNVVFSITCLAPASREAEYLPAFDHAGDSARFILIPAAGAAS